MQMQFASNKSNLLMAPYLGICFMSLLQIIFISS